MSTISILHLSDVDYLVDVSPIYLVELLKVSKLRNPDFLIVTGCTLTGHDEDLISVRVALDQLMKSFDLGPDQILIAPRLSDLRGDKFSTWLHKPLTGVKFTGKPRLLHLPPHMQFFCLNTINAQPHTGPTNAAFDASLAAAIRQIEDGPCPPSFLRGMAFYHPPMMWKNPPTQHVQRACQEHRLHLAFIGGGRAKFTSRFQYSIGVEAGMMHYFQYKPTRGILSSTFGHLVDGTWLLGDHSETLLRQFQPKPAKE